MDDVVQAIGLGLVNETVDQITGRSRGKWAVALVAFLAGAGVALWFLNRRRAKPTAPSADITT